MENIYFMEINEDFSEQQQAMLAFLSMEKQQKILSLRFAVDKKLSLFADVLVRCLACQIHNLKNQDMVFEQNDFGKPYLAGFPAFQFNISHTRNALVVAISNQAVGIDIEKVQQANLRIAQQFFTAKEVAWIYEEAEKQDERFYAVWTQKEAYLKWLGKGISMPLSSFDILEDGFKENLLSIRFGDYLISVFTNAHFNRSALEILTEQDLLKMSCCLLS